MSVALWLLTAVLGASSASSGDDADGIFALSYRAERCDARAIVALLARSRREGESTTYNAANVEALSESNEAVFLACPRPFLRAAAASDDSTRRAAAYYFGHHQVQCVRHVLHALRDDSEFRATIDAVFVDLLRPETRRPTASPQRAF